MSKQVTSSDSQSGSPKEDRKTVTAQQLNQEIDEWLKGQTIEGQRRARIIKASVLHLRAGEGDVGYTIKELLVENRGYIPEGDVSEQECATFIDVLNKEGKQKIIADVLGKVSRDKEQWGDEWRKHGRRGRFLTSLDALSDFVSGRLPEAKTPEARKKLSEQEKDARRMYVSMHGSFNLRTGRQQVSDVQLLFYRMLRVATILRPREVDDIKKALRETMQMPVTRLQWVEYAEPRMGVGLTDADRKRGYELVYSFAPAEWLSRAVPTHIPSLEKQVRRAHGYRDAVEALDAFMKDPRKFPQWAQEKTKPAGK
jgi:hypothetical protein